MKLLMVLALVAVGCVIGASRITLAYGPEDFKPIAVSNDSASYTLSPDDMINCAINPTVDPKKAYDLINDFSEVKIHTFSTKQVDGEEVPIVSLIMKLKTSDGWKDACFISVSLFSNKGSEAALKIMARFAGVANIEQTTTSISTMSIAQMSNFAISGKISEHVANVLNTLVKDGIPIVENMVVANVP